MKDKTLSHVTQYFHYNQLLRNLKKIDEQLNEEFKGYLLEKDNKSARKKGGENRTKHWEKTIDELKKHGK